MSLCLLIMLSSKGHGLVGGKSSIFSSAQMRVLVAGSHFVQNELEVRSVPTSTLPNPGLRDQSCG